MGELIIILSPNWSLWEVRSDFSSTFRRLWAVRKDYPPSFGVFQPWGKIVISLFKSLRLAERFFLPHGVFKLWRIVSGLQFEVTVKWRSLSFSAFQSVSSKVSFLYQITSWCTEAAWLFSCTKHQCLSVNWNNILDTICLTRTLCSVMCKFHNSPCACTRNLLCLSAVWYLNTVANGRHLRYTTFSVGNLGNIQNF